MGTPFIYFRITLYSLATMMVMMICIFPKLLLAKGKANGQEVAIDNPILRTGTLDVGVGFTSTYLPINKGYLTTHKYATDPRKLLPTGANPNLIVVDKSEKTLMGRFDHAREQLLGKGGDERLNDFFHYYGFDPEEAEWRGMCHQWGAANCDPKVKNILSGNDDNHHDGKKSNILCGDDVFEIASLEELFTGTYPSKNTLFLGSARNSPNEHYNQAFFYKKNMDFIDEHGGIDAFKKINTTDFLILDSLGKFFLKGGNILPDRWGMPPHLFHQTAIRGLENGGFVLDVDPLEEVWNQPVFKMESEASTIANDAIDLPYFRYDADDAASGNNFFFEASNDANDPKSIEVKALLTKMNQIDSVLKIAIEARTKTPDQKLSDLVKHYSSSLSKGRVLDSDLIALVEKTENEISNLTDNGDKKERSITLAATLQSLMTMKLELFKKAKDSGLKLKDNFIMQKFTTKISYMDEDDDFGAVGKVVATNTYNYIVVKNKNNGFIYSNWIGGFEKGNRPDFLWLPELQSNSCHQKAECSREDLKRIIKNKEYIENEGDDINEFAEKNRVLAVRDICLQTGLSDLLKLCNSPSLAQAYQEVSGLIQQISDVVGEIKKSAVREKLAAQMDKINKLKIIVNRDEFNRELQKKNLPVTLDDNLQLKFVGASD